jgi:hypothetical protein
MPHVYAAVYIVSLNNILIKILGCSFVGKQNGGIKTCYESVENDVTAFCNGCG